MFCFQAEGGIRYRTVTGVQTCALPISRAPAAWHLAMWSPELNAKLLELAQTKVALYDAYISEMRSEERRVGKECSSRWAAERYKDNDQTSSYVSGPPVTAI